MSSPPPASQTNLATQCTSPTHTQTTLKVGIAVYAQTDARRNRPRGPHWALVLHPTTFSASDVRVYHIRGRNGVWTLGHEVCELKELGDLVGVISLGFVQEKDLDGRMEGESLGLSLRNHTLDTLDAYLKTLPPTRNDRDPSGLLIWTCESYVIRAVADLEEAGALDTLPCRPNGMYDWTRKRIVALKKVKEENVAGREGQDDSGVWAVPFVDEDLDNPT